MGGRMEPFRIIFADLPDPRDCNAGHALDEILFIALAAMLCGAQTCVDIADFGEAKEPLLRQFLTLAHGIPSHDTFSRIFRRLDPVAFEACFQRFVAVFGTALGQGAPRGVVPIDGKSLRRAYEKGKAHMPKMIVSAFAAETRMTLAQSEAPDGNEVAGALRVLELLSLKGCIVTADALHCHKRMADAVLAAGADYVLAIKGNQSALARDVTALLDAHAPALPCAETTDQDHDRVERRKAFVLPAPELAAKHDFPGLVAIGQIDASRTSHGITKHNVRRFVLSLQLAPPQFLSTVREHWSIENKAHWPLDVVFNEDNARNRKDNGPRNLAALRRLTLNILRRDTSKGSLAVKRKRAGWNDDFLVGLWTQMR